MSTNHYHRFNHCGCCIADREAASDRKASETA